MNRKISLGIVIGLLVLAVALSSAASVGVMTREYDRVLAGLPQKLERYEILDELDDIINKHYYGKSVESDIEQAIAQGYVSSLGDKGSKYMTASQYTSFLAERNGNISGIGIEYTRTAESYLEITSVDSSSPAADAGLQEGDLIIAFDGIMLDAENYDNMVDKLTSEKVTGVNLIYKRGETETTANITKGYSARSVVTDVYENVGYISITDFYPSTVLQVEEAVNRFAASQLGAIVIDLRKNTSDNYEVAMQVLDLFVPMSDSSKAAATVVDEDGNTVKTFTTTAGEVNIPVGVLVSAKTKQAAELFACNLRDFGKGLIFAERTTGKSALYQEVFELSKGNAVLLTTGKVLPYSSESFDGVGLTPDYVLEAKAGKGAIASDGQFLYAVSVLVK